MNVLAELKERFRPALEALVLGRPEARPTIGRPEAESTDVVELLEMIRPAQDAKFGDYQANFAMSLGKRLGKPPREVATELLKQAKLDDLCQQPEIAGPGFINLRLRDEWLTAQLNAAVQDERLGISPAKEPKTVVVDYSSPNVAKPMHVGHIRSTVIGDALTRTLRFLGHRAISDNHLGDWGTQFGMIIYGYKHFVDRAAYAAAPVAELSRLYKLVHRLVDYRDAVKALPAEKQRLVERLAEVERLKVLPKTGDKAADKKSAQALSKAHDAANSQTEVISALEIKIATVESDPQLSKLAAAHATIDDAVLQETAKLHADDAENLRLWHEFLPNCRDEIARVYGRLNVTFDYEYGESFYHDRLAAVVADLRKKGLAEDSQGATCVFVEGFDTPMIVQKKDGAFLYATTDLATIQFRMETWRPNTILYVVDHRQSEHFDKLFAVARRWGYTTVDLQHVKFGTVMGSDGRPYKTREGTAAGLESLLDEAVTRAAAVVAENDGDGRLSADERRQIADVVGMGALKYADLSQNRASDYTFSYDKMLLMNGNTATYMQYSYARVRSIFAKGGFEAAAVRASGVKIVLSQPAERALGLQLLRLEESLAQVEAESMPHYLTGYLFDVAKAYSAFFENCPVLKAESEVVRDSRLLLCDLTARTIRLGLDLLGIQVIERM
jgi:arginyl-tRNA synthetase